MNSGAMKMIASSLLSVLLALSSSLASAWWNKDWNSRKQLVLDAGVTGANIDENLTDVPVLVRLHAGNFGYFAELAEHGNDLRLQVDDKTPAKFHVEKIDTAGEIALLWVRAPHLTARANSDALWLYYGNRAAAAGSDAGATYDTPQVLVFHFGDDGLPRDSTAYGNHALESKATTSAAGLIGAAAAFDGSGAISVKPSPSLAVDPQKGWTFTAWVKVDQPQTSAKIFEAREGAHALALALQGNALSANFDDQHTAAAPLQPGKWQHVAVVLQGGKISLYIDGEPAGSAAVAAVAFNPALSIGGGAGGDYLHGAIDEVGIAAAARSAAWIRFLARSQSPDFSAINFGEDETNGSSGESGYFTVILQNITVDGWVVIALTGVMFVIAALVIVLKSIAIARVNRDNSAFLQQYQALDAAPGAGVEQISSANSDRFVNSTLYRLYHLGNQEVGKRNGAAHAAATPEALNLVQVRLDAAVVRESQQLNRNMVLLTIAIAGGPFLGLLGTVMGVMITFAAIAATGDVNINSIAPGIAAALAATVAGLAVAIPSLFGYNYLLTQIKDITADMRVFSDEFVAALSASAAERREERQP